MHLIDSKTSQSSSQTTKPVAIVTGAAKGIGRALLDELRQRGYIVIGVVRSLSDVSELFTLDPENVFPIRCDVTEPSTEIVLREFLESQIDKVDLLINNAGFGATGYGIEKLKFDELESVLAVHCFGAIRCLKACLPWLRKSKNAIVINISSRFGSLEWVSTGKVGHERTTYAYRIAKAALNMFTSSLAAELRNDGIKVLSVDPGKVKTRIALSDADVEPAEAARAIINLAQSTSETGVFLNTAGEKLPW